MHSNINIMSTPSIIAKTSAGFAAVEAALATLPKIVADQIETAENHHLMGFKCQLRVGYETSQNFYLPTDVKMIVDRGDEVSIHCHGKFYFFIPKVKDFKISYEFVK